MRIRHGCKRSIVAHYQCDPNLGPKDSQSDPPFAYDRIWGEFLPDERLLMAHSGRAWERAQGLLMTHSGHSSASHCDAVISFLAQRLGERLDGGVDYRFIEARIAEN